MSQMDDRRPQVVAAFLLDQARAVLGRHVVDARLPSASCSISALMASAWLGTVNAARADFGIFRRQRLDRARCAAARASAIFLRVPRRPDAGAVDAAAAAVDEDAVGHDVEVLLPFVDLVVAQQDLAEAGAVGLHARVALVLLDRGRAAEDQAARATAASTAAPTSPRPG